MGKKKIKIQFIGVKKNRNVTFKKRKTGIVKKCSELATLTSSKILLVIKNIEGKTSIFSTKQEDESDILNSLSYLTALDESEELREQQNNVVEHVYQNSNLNNNNSKQNDANNNNNTNNINNRSNQNDENDDY